MKYIFFIITIILFTTSVAAQCSDSDGGKNKYESGIVADQEKSFEDTCEGENIKEYFCSIEGIASYTTLPCVNSCLEGACQLANDQPKALAPAEEGSSNLKVYFYGFIILLTIGVYVYLFKWKKNKKKY